MRIGKYHIEIGTYYYKPTLEFGFEHKYWYLWDLYVCGLYIEICRTDWNKCYKDSCKNYKSSCKHIMDCNQCKECYEN